METSTGKEAQLRRVALQILGSQDKQHELCAVRGRDFAIHRQLGKENPGD